MQDNSAEKQPQNTNLQGQGPNVAQSQQQVENPQQEKSIFRTAWFMVFLVSIVLLIAWVGIIWFYVLPSVTQTSQVDLSGGYEQRTQGEEELFGTQLSGDNQIVVNDQRITEDLEIQVEKVEVNANSFLVFYMPPRKGRDEPELMIAGTSVLEPDVYESFGASIFTQEQGIVTEDQFERIMEGGEVYAVLHKDVNGDTLFDPSIDNVRLKNDLGTVVRETFELSPLSGSQ